MEGEILWKKDHYAIRYFEDGDEHLQSLALGDEIEVLVNDAWKKVKVEAKSRFSSASAMATASAARRVLRRSSRRR